MYLVADVRNAHTNSQGTFYRRLEELDVKKLTIGRRTYLYHPNFFVSDSPSNKPSSAIVCQGMNNQGNPCKQKYTTADTHADRCQREEKHFCWIHCDCSYCSQLMGGPTKRQGQYYKGDKQ